MTHIHTKLCHTKFAIRQKVEIEFQSYISKLTLPGQRYFLYYKIHDIEKFNTALVKKEKKEKKEV